MREIWVDGAGWNGRISRYAVVYDNGAQSITRCIGEKTNNEMEYQALLSALFVAELEKNTEIKIYSDSQLVVRQMSGEYSIRADNLKDVARDCKKIMKENPNIKLIWIPREKNKAGILLERTKHDY